MHVQSMVVPMAQACHGKPPQDDSTNGTVQHDYGFVCHYVALQPDKIKCGAIEEVNLTVNLTVNSVFSTVFFGVLRS